MRLIRLGQFSHSVMSNSLWPHGSQHARLSCPSPTPGVYSNPCSLSSDAIQPSHPLLSPSPAFNISQHQSLFQWIGSSHQVAKVLELQHQSFQWIFRTDFLEDGLVGSPCSPSDSQESSPTPQFKSTNSSVLSFLYSPTLTSIHDYGKTRALTRQTFISKVMSLFFNMLSRFVIAFPPRSKHLNFMVAVTIHSDFGAQENKAFHCFHYFPLKWWGNSGNMMDAIFLAVWLLTFKPAFSLSSFTFIKRLFSFSLLSAIRVVSSALSEVIDISPSNLDFSLCFIQLSISHDVLCL